MVNKKNNKNISSVVVQLAIGRQDGHLKTEWSSRAAISYKDQGLPVPIW